MPQLLHPLPESNTHAPELTSVSPGSWVIRGLRLHLCDERLGEDRCATSTHVAVERKIPANLKPSDTLNVMNSLFKFPQRTRACLAHYAQVAALARASFLVLALSVCPGCGNDDSVAPKASAPPPVDAAALKAKADAGDAKAQFEFGNLLMKPGPGAPDYKAAAGWFRKSAAAGWADAAAVLGELTAAGQGVKRDPKAAVELFRQAAEKGSVSGQYNLGYCYERGSGVENDETQAAKWYLRAAEGGDATAQYDIAQRFELGLGCATNLVESYKWYAIAIKNRQPDAKAKFSALKARLSSGQIKEAEQLVSGFVPEAH
jgi:hypothetical protein